MQPLKLPPLPAPPPPAGLTETLLDQQLATMTAAMEEALNRARAVDPDKDEYGHRAAAEMDQVFRLAEKSAQVAQAKAKLKSEMRMLHHVTRVDGNPKPDNGRAAHEYVPDPDLPKPTDAEMNTLGGGFQFMKRWLAAKAKKADWEAAEARAKLAEMLKEEEEDRLTDEAEKEKEAGTPSPLANGCSNGQACFEAPPDGVAPQHDEASS